MERSKNGTCPMLKGRPKNSHLLVIPTQILYMPTRVHQIITQKIKIWNSSSLYYNFVPIYQKRCYVEFHRFPLRIRGASDAEKSEENFHSGVAVSYAGEPLQLCITPGLGRYLAKEESNRLMVHQTIKTGSKAIIQDSTMVSMDTGSLMYRIQDPGNLHLLLATLLLSI